MTESEKSLRELQDRSLQPSGISSPIENSQKANETMPVTEGGANVQQHVNISVPNKSQQDIATSQQHGTSQLPRTNTLTCQHNNEPYLRKICFYANVYIMTNRTCS